MILYLVGSLANCNDYLEYKSAAVIDEQQVFQNPDEMVSSAYIMLGGDWYGYPFNFWTYGGVAPDDALKSGSGTTDTDYHQVEVFAALIPALGHPDELWCHPYITVSRCNRALAALQDNGEAKLGTETTKQRIAEVKSLRTHFYLELKTVFNKVPWIGEDAYRSNSQEQIKNDKYITEQLWEKIIADFKEAYDVLPATRSQGGRVSKVAAAVYLVECYLEKE